jgi:heme-degrading monooxygenase HmoA
MDHYTSGDWFVKPGSEDEFVSRWQAFVGDAKATVRGAKSFVLIPDTSNRQHFVSVGTWADLASVDAWRQHPDFARQLSAVRELCERDYNANYTLAASPTESVKV